MIRIEGFKAGQCTAGEVEKARVNVDDLGNFLFFTKAAYLIYFFILGNLIRFSFGLSQGK